MRSVIWLFILFVAAVASALFLGDNKATITLFWPPYRVDMSFNLLLVILLLLVGLLVLAFRALSNLRKIQFNAKQWRQQQQERSLQHLFLTATENYAQGDYARAQELALQTIEHAQHILSLPHDSQDETSVGSRDWARSAKTTALWLAAQSAYARGEHAQGDTYLQQYLRRKKNLSTQTAVSSAPPDTPNDL